MDIPKINSQGEVVGSQSLPDPIFGVSKTNPHEVHEVIRAYLANQRSGTHSTLTRSEVSGGGRKPWKQKHTGRARAGSTRSPLWRKGGIIFGPKPRNYRINLPHSKVKHVLNQVLSQKAANGELVVIERPILEKSKTKEVAQWMKNLKVETPALLVLEKKDDKFSVAARNIENLAWVEWKHIHPYHLLWAKKVLFSQEAIECLSANGRS